MNMRQEKFKMLQACNYLIDEHLIKNCVFDKIHELKMEICAQLYTKYMRENDQ